MLKFFPKYLVLYAWAVSLVKISYTENFDLAFLADTVYHNSDLPVN